MFEIQKIRKDFPILNQKVHGHPLVYFDNAATMQMPQKVLNAITDHYVLNNANVHRGIYQLSERSTAQFESARNRVKEFLNAKDSNEIIFTSGTTDAINTVCYGISTTIDSGDHILVSELEHNSNLLPWQRLCQQKHATLDFLPCPDGNPNIKAFEDLLTNHPKIVALPHVSNLTGTVFPLKELIKKAHKAGALVLIDGAQGILHGMVDVQDLDCDYYCFSGHKMMAPFGIGILYGKQNYLEQLEPMKLGGGMVDSVSKNKTTYGLLPYKLEAGTPNIAGAIGLMAAIDYIEQIGRKEAIGYETALLDYAKDRLSEIEELSFIGHPKDRAGILTFSLSDIHPFDAVSFLDKYGIALRSGTLCNQIGLSIFQKETAIRMSTAFYNTKEEIDYTAESIKSVIQRLNRYK